MDSIQRLLRRKVAIESIANVLLREAPYHRLHKSEQSSEPLVVWTFDNDDGTSEPLF